MGTQFTFWFGIVPERGKLFRADSFHRNQVTVDTDFAKPGVTSTRSPSVAILVTADTSRFNTGFEISLRREPWPARASTFKNFSLIELFCVAFTGVEQENERRVGRATASQCCALRPYSVTSPTPRSAPPSHWSNRSYRGRLLTEATAVDDQDPPASPADSTLRVRLPGNRRQQHQRRREHRSPSVSTTPAQSGLTVRAGPIVLRFSPATDGAWHLFLSPSVIKV